MLATSGAAHLISVSPGTRALFSDDLTKIIHAAVPVIPAILFKDYSEAGLSDVFGERIAKLDPPAVS